MYSTVYLASLVVAFASDVSAASSSTATLALGQQCDPSASQCAPGVSCYAVNSEEIPYCGSFQGTCTSTSQCATNECVNGLCGGPLLPALGDNCTASFLNAEALPCAYGAGCYAVNSMLITRCGNFQSSCTWDGQCAFNKCQNGFCAGPLLSSSSFTTVTATAPPSESLSTTPPSIPTRTATDPASESLSTTPASIPTHTATDSASESLSTTPASTPTHSATNLVSESTNLSAIPTVTARDLVSESTASTAITTVTATDPVSGSTTSTPQSIPTYTATA